MKAFTPFGFLFMLAGAYLLVSSLVGGGPLSQLAIVQQSCGPDVCARAGEVGPAFWCDGPQPTPGFSKGWCIIGVSSGQTGETNTQYPVKECVPDGYAGHLEGYQIGTKNQGCTVLARTDNPQAVGGQIYCKIASDDTTFCPNVLNPASSSTVEDPATEESNMETTVQLPQENTTSETETPITPTEIVETHVGPNIMPLIGLGLIGVGWIV